MKYETFAEEFGNLTIDAKVDIFNEYCLNYGDSDNMLYSFDDEFFEMSFSSKMEVARATFFGNIESWSDEYIRFDAYGNLESLSEYSAEGEIEYYLEDIFEHEDVWDNYIDNVDDDEEEEEDDEDGDEE